MLCERGKNHGGSNLLCERGENHEGAAMRREGTAGVSMVHMVIKATNGNEEFVTNKMKKF